MAPSPLPAPASVWLPEALQTFPALTLAAASYQVSLAVDSGKACRVSRLLGDICLVLVAAPSAAGLDQHRKHWRGEVSSLSLKGSFRAVFLCQMQLFF